MVSFVHAKSWGKLFQRKGPAGAKALWREWTCIQGSEGMLEWRPGVGGAPEDEVGEEGRG